MGRIVVARRPGSGEGGGAYALAACARYRRRLKTIRAIPPALEMAGPNIALGRYGPMPHDSDYYRARAMEERERADNADRVYLANLHRELAQQLEKLEAQAKVATRYKEYHSDLQLKQHLLWFLRRRDAAAERERHTQEIAKATNALEAETAELRSIESRMRGIPPLQASGRVVRATGLVLEAMQGRIGIHNARLAYPAPERRFAAARYAVLAARGGSGAGRPPGGPVAFRAHQQPGPRAGARAPGAVRARS